MNDIPEHAKGMFFYNDKSSPELFKMGVPVVAAKRILHMADELHETVCYMDEAGLINKQFALINKRYKELLDICSVMIDKSSEFFNTIDNNGKAMTIFDFDVILFPDNPIRDWSERKIMEIDNKYKWSVQL